MAMNTLQHQGAFVLQLRADCILSGELLAGRIEHVASGRIGHFQSREELIEVFDRLVTEVRSTVRPGS
jgi:hypothetical protein